MGVRKVPAHHAGTITRSSMGLTPKKLLGVEPSCETCCDRRKGFSDKLTKRHWRLIRRSVVPCAVRPWGLTRCTQEKGLKRAASRGFQNPMDCPSLSLEVTKYQLLKQRYWMPQPPRLDRQALLIAMKRGGDIPGVQLGNPKPILTVRTK
jgi:hypothetical protein